MVQVVELTQGWVGRRVTDRPGRDWHVVPGSAILLPRNAGFRSRNTPVTSCDGREGCQHEMKGPIQIRSGQALISIKKRRWKDKNPGSALSELDGQKPGA